jgi:hypothetical protein
MRRAGYAWVGVSAQQSGVQALQKWDPVRYGTLHHPGDTYSYSIYSQAAEALLHPGGVNPLGPLHPRLLIADGDSQSAGRLVTYANAVQPIDHLYNAFLIHSRDASGAPISQAPESAPTIPAADQTRTDLSVPVLTVQVETDIIASGRDYLPATQPDSSDFRLWEVPGTSHIDADELGMFNSEVQRDVPDFPPMPCGDPPNDGQEGYVMDAALAQLNRWARTGVPAPAAPRIDVVNGQYVTDQYGDAYVADVQRAAASDVKHGFLLPADAEQIVDDAAASLVELPVPSN